MLSWRVDGLEWAIVSKQPGSSSDEEVISVARKRNIPMVLTGMRHFKH